MKTKVFIALSFSVLLSVTAIAQEKEKKFALEISGGPSFATSQFTEGLRMGFGIDGTIHYKFTPTIGVYAGWGENWFSSETTSSNTNKDFEETGYVLGLQFKQPFRSSSYSYFLRAGALYNHVEVTNDDEAITEDTGHGLGLQLAAGMDISLGSSWSLTPVVKYNSMLQYLNSDGGSMDIKYNYLSVRIGIQKMF